MSPIGGRELPIDKVPVGIASSRQQKTLGGTGRPTVVSEWIDDNGWRDLSPAMAKRACADTGVKDSGAELYDSLGRFGCFVLVLADWFRTEPC